MRKAVQIQFHRCVQALFFEWLNPTHNSHGQIYNITLLQHNTLYSQKMATAFAVRWDDVNVTDVQHTVLDTPQQQHIWLFSVLISDNPLPTQFCPNAVSRFWHDFTDPYRLEGKRHKWLSYYTNCMMYVFVLWCTLAAYVNQRLW